MRRARAIPVAIVAALALTACGGAEDGDGDEPAVAPAPTVTVTVTETAAPSDTGSLAETPTPEPTATSQPATDPCAASGLDAFAFIFVTSHASGSTLASGDTVEGCSNTFEATFQYELLDSQSAVLDDGFGTATCGTGCVGTWSFSPSFSVSAQEVGTLRVYASSAQDGSDTLVNSIPVLLQP